MRVFWGVGIGVVHTVQNGICARRQERRTLANVSEKEKEFFPERVHREHFMRWITVQVKRLHKKGKVPVNYKKQDNDHEKTVWKWDKKLISAGSKTVGRLNRSKITNSAANLLCPQSGILEK